MSIMKTLCLFITIVLGIVACSEQETILDFSLPEGLANRLDSVKVIFDEKAYAFPLDKEGKGRLVMSVNHDGFALLVYGKRMTDIYLKRGNELKVCWNPRDWKGSEMEIVSNDGGINQYIRYVIERSFQAGVACSFTLEDEEYVRKVDSTIQSINVEIDGTDFSAEIKDMLKASAKYNILYWIYKYPRFHHLGKRMTKEDFLAFKHFRHYLFDHFEEQPKCLALTSYREYAVHWFYELMQVEAFDDPYVMRKEKACQYILDHVKDDLLKEYLIAETVTPYIRSEGIEGADKIVEYCRTNVRNPMYTYPFEQNYNYWAKIQPGKDAFNFNYQDINGNSVQLSDFKGKYVFIDIWATWCKPCCYEIPFIKEIEHRLKDKNIVFVSISKDKDLDVWKNYVKNENMGGLQLNYGRNSDFMDYFYITGIPRFIIIDPNQKIVTARAPKPSSGELEVLLNNLLN